MLCQWGIELSERTQLPLYFESSPTTLGLYQKMGFELLKENVVHKAETLGTPVDVTVPLMIRMPSAAGGMSFDEWRQKGYPKFTAKPLSMQALAALAASASLKEKPSILKTEAIKANDVKPASTVVETTVEIVS